jgi:hypothetical protein
MYSIVELGSTLAGLGALCVVGGKRAESREAAMSVGVAAAAALAGCMS